MDIDGHAQTLPCPRSSHFDWPLSPSPHPWHCPVVTSFPCEVALGCASVKAVLLGLRNTQ